MTSTRVCPGCRATILSRYNADPLCAKCARSARDRDPAPAWLWDSEPIRRALARRDLAGFLVIFRNAVGLSQLELGDIVDGWSQSTVSLIENRRRGTLFDIRELLRFADAIGMPRWALLPLVFGDPGVILEAEGPSDQGDTVDVNRRSFNEIMAGLVAGAALPAPRIPTRVDMGHVRYLQESLRQIRSGIGSVGGSAVMAQANHHFTWAKTLLDDSDYTETVGRDLVTVAAELGDVSGWAAYDANDQQAARRLYGDAELLAGSCDDATIRTHVYSNLAQQSTYLARSTGKPGLARAALRFTAQAGEVARHEPSPRLHALIAVRESLAHAELGDERGFRKAITTARRELDRGTHPSDPSWTDFVTPSEVTGLEAAGYEALGRRNGTGDGRSATLYRQVVDDASRSARDRTCYRAALARSLFQHGDVKLALGEAAEVLPSVSGVASGRALIELRPLREAAHKAAAAEFCERYDAAVRSIST